MKKIFVPIALFFVMIHIAVLYYGFTIHKKNEVCGLERERYKAGGEFFSKQIRYPRVEKAYDDKYCKIAENLKSHNINIEFLNILIAAYKDEGVLELYGKNTDDAEYRLIKSYPIVKKSGYLGPKKREGDKQVPEGFYYIDRFNPNSSYYLSLGINYPNESDIKKGFGGSDIFIHGSFKSAGCLPVTDDKIKEIYLYALYARDNKQVNIPVYIFPFKMNLENTEKFLNRYNDDELISFWRNLQEGYDIFKEHQKELVYETGEKGEYVFK